jgi:hypothetical protein
VQVGNKHRPQGFESLRFGGVEGESNVIGWPCCLENPYSLGPDSKRLDSGATNVGQGRASQAARRILFLNTPTLSSRRVDDDVSRLNIPHRVMP